MSKVICDVCGVTYPETASVCPICGTAKATTAQTAARMDLQDEEDAVSYTKGGHFSKRNVKKRNQEKTVATKAARPERPAKAERPARTERPERYDRPVRREKNENNKTNLFLVIVIILLLIAIVVVAFYIAANYFLPGESEKPNGPNQTTPPATTTQPPHQIPCRTIKLSSTTIELTFASQAWLLSAEVGPDNTTDELTFISSDENVITVEKNGKDCLITAVGGGEATVTAICGDVEATCTVICSFAPIGGTTEPSTEPKPTVPEGFELKLVYTDISLFYENENYALFKAVDGVTAADIKWTSDDPSVARVDENGRVYAVNRGTTTIRAEIDGRTATCKIRCKFDKVETNGNYVSCLGKAMDDITMKVGETLSISLVNAEGVNLGATWTVDREGYVTISGNKITAKEVTIGTSFHYVTISCEYEGVTYKCIIRVRAAS